MANPCRKTLHISSPATMGAASATQARDTRESQSQSVQASSGNDSDAALDTLPNTEFSEPANGRSDSGHKQDGEEARNGKSCLAMCRLLKRRSDVEKLLKVSEAVIDIREDSGDILIVLNTAVLAIACLETLLDCEAKRGFDVMHRTQENASSDTGERMYREIIDELRFCKIAFDVRQAGAESAFKCYKTTSEAHGIYDIHYVWNERAGEENENAEFVA